MNARPERVRVLHGFGLVASGCVPRQCRVQVPLLDLLCAYGADPTSALLTALAHEEMDAGEDPNRYNPVGLHVHSAPLRQAAARGHDKVVRLLVERGARPDMPDTLG